MAPADVAIILAPPTAYRVTLLLAVIVTLLFPFCSSPLLIVVMLPVVKIALLASMLPTLALPVTPSEVSVPTLVIFGCAAVVTVPAVVALVAAPLKEPTKVVAVMELFDKLAMSPVLVNSATLPVAAFAKIRKLLPVPATTLIPSATFA